MADTLLGKMRVEIVGDNSKLDKSLKDSKKDTEKFGKSTAKLGASLGKLFTGIGFALVAKKLFDLGKQAETLFQIQEKAEAKLDATLLATGNAAGLSAEELKKMATELQNVTTVGDEATIGAEALLLTFKSIGGDVFPRALESILDVSEAMGQDLKSSTIQIGKALNDPIAGLSALSRVGIQFSDVQKDLIKGFQNSGDLASAQGVILEELESQFGGVARAAALTSEGIQIQLNNSIGDMQEAIGESISNGLTPWRKSLQLVVERFTELISKQNTAKDFIRDFSDGIIDTERSLEDLQTTLSELEKQRGQAGRGTSQALKDEIQAVTALIAAYGIEDQFLIKAAESQLAATRAAEDAAAKQQKVLDIEQSAIEKLSELRAVELTDGEKQVENLQDQIDNWAQFRDIPGVQELINELISDRNELLEENNEKIEENLTVEQIAADERLALALNFEEELKARDLRIAEFEEEQRVVKEEAENALRERQIAAAEAAAITMEMIQKIGLNSVLSGFEDIGAALVEGELGFDDLGKVALNAIAEIVAALGAQLAAQAALAFFPFFGIPNISSGIGASAGAAAAFAASGAIKAVAASFETGGTVAGTSFTGDNVPILVNSREDVLTSKQSSELMSFIKGGMGSTTNNSNGNITINSMFSLGNDKKLNEAAKALFAPLQRESQRRGASIGGL